MEVTMDIDISNKAELCKFGQKCLEGFDYSSCCTINKADENYLFVTPVSTFKSQNCSYIRKIRKDDVETHICTCPIRMEIFLKLSI